MRGMVKPDESASSKPALLRLRDARAPVGDEMGPHSPTLDRAMQKKKFDSPDASAEKVAARGPYGTDGDSFALNRY